MSEATRIEITEDTILKLLIRRGSNLDRQQIVLTEGELGYTVDTQRLFVGDGYTTGAIPTSITFFGSINAVTTYTDAEVNDIAYRTTTGLLYRLIQKPASNIANWEIIGGPGSTRVDDETIQNNPVDGVISVKSISGSQLYGGVVGQGLEFYGSAIRTISAQNFDTIATRNRSYITIPSSIRFDETDGSSVYSFPLGDGPADTVLTTNGAGYLSWTVPAYSTQTLVLSSELIPVGTIIRYASGGSIGSVVSAYNIPSNYFLCDGRAILSGDYLTLYNVISNFYGFISAGKVQIPNLTASDSLWLIKHTSDPTLQITRINIDNTLSGYDTTLQQTVTSIVMPNTGNIVHLTVRDYASKSYTESLIIGPSAFQADDTDGNGGEGYQYSTFIDTDGMVRFSGKDSGFATGMGSYGTISAATTPEFITLPVEFTATNLFHSSPEDASQVYTVGKTIFVLSNLGKLYSAGQNDFGICGVGSTATYITKFTPVGNSIFTSDPIAKFTISKTPIRSDGNSQRCAIALTQSGKLYGWGYNGSYQLGMSAGLSYNTPTQITDDGAGSTTWKDVWTFGAETGFSFAIDTDNRLFACGSDNYKQLTSGNVGVPVYTFSEVMDFPSNQVYAEKVYGAASLSSCSNGVATTFILSGGKLWGAGSFTSGQLGNHTLSSVYALPNFPRFMPVSGTVANTALTGVKYFTVSCAQSGSSTGATSSGVSCAAITSAGELYVWGYNKGGQLGFGHSNNSPIPSITTSLSVIVEDEYDLPIKAKFFGYEQQTTLTVLTLSGGIFSSGYNGSGVFGNGTGVGSSQSFVAAMRPYYINYYDFKYGGESPSTGFILARASRPGSPIKRLYTWGNNRYNQCGINAFSSGSLATLSALYAPLKPNINF